MLGYKSVICLNQLICSCMAWKVLNTSTGDNTLRSSDNKDLQSDRIQFISSFPWVFFVAIELDNRSETKSSTISF